jgi:hypothetical protein
VTHTNLDKNDSIAPSISPEEANALGKECGELMITESLSETQEKRLDDILYLATINEIVDFWVSYEICSRGIKTGLLTASELHNYENQKAYLREHLETNPILKSQTKSDIEENLRLQIKLVELKFIEAIQACINVIPPEKESSSEKGNNQS